MLCSFGVLRGSAGHRQLRSAGGFSERLRRFFDTSEGVLVRRASEGDARGRCQSGVNS